MGPALGVEAAEPYCATYLAGWALGDLGIVHAAPDCVTANARTILASIDGQSHGHTADAKIGGRRPS